jgi:hypothetical protein
VRIFKNSRFDRFASKEEISDEELKAIVAELEDDKWEANLGGGVYKKRVARPNEGKAGGYRVLVFFKGSTRAFFAYGFAKNVRGNISEKDLKRLKEISKEILAVSDEVLKNRIDAGKWIELTDTEAKK